MNTLDEIWEQGQIILSPNNSFGIGCEHAVMYCVFLITCICGVDAVKTFKFVGNLKHISCKTKVW